MRYRVRTDDVAWRVVDGEAVLVHADTSAYYGLNRAGTRLWEALADGPRSADELALRLSSAPDASPQRARLDVDDFLSSLAEAGLVAEAIADSAEGPGSDPADAEAGSAEAGGYEPPRLSPFGELEQLILSGE